MFNEKRTCNWNILINFIYSKVKTKHLSNITLVQKQ